jgi:hypothetical protein
MVEKVQKRTEDTDNALKKFFKGICMKMKEQHPSTWQASNIFDIIDKLN